MDLGKAIKVCRVARGMTQVELAETVGISNSYMSLIERDKRDPVMSTVECIAIALDVPLIIIVFLATDDGDLALGNELREKLSSATFRLIKNGAGG